MREVAHSGKQWVCHKLAKVETIGCTTEVAKNGNNWNDLLLYRERKSLFCHFWQYFASLSCQKWQLFAA